MIVLTDDQYKMIEEYSGLFLHPDEIAILLDIDTDVFARMLQDKKSMCYKHYTRGKTLSKMHIRKNIIAMAKNGSAQAEMLAGKFASDQAVAETEL
jgi:hypothetical protein